VNFQLLDTNVLIFFLQDHPLLPERVAERIENPDLTSIVSMVSLWEISIKVGIGKLDFKPAEDPDFPEMLKANGFDVQPINWSTMLRTKELPNYHRNPFDRYLIAEALLQNIPILSTDSKLDQYGVWRIG
jgi:PIN domain nuclease of toxin-antitoxin system